LKNLLCAVSGFYASINLRLRLCLCLCLSLK
jgi:hypothetical protein